MLTQQYHTICPYAYNDNTTDCLCYDTALNYCPLFCLYAYFLLLIQVKVQYDISATCKCHTTHRQATN